MQVSVENVSTLERKLTLKIPADQLESKVNERVVEMGRTVRLNGFRPGRVPVQVIRQRFGDRVRGEVLSDLVGDSLREAFEQEKLYPVAQPVIDTDGKAEDGEIACTATFEVMPELPEVDVSALEIERADAEVGDADIDNMIETLRNQRRHFDVVERAAAKDDHVLLEYVATTDDHRVPEEGTQRISGIIGAGNLLPAIEEAVTGHKAGDEVAAEVAFPEDFGNEKLAGKTAQLALTVKQVREPQVPELDETFIRQFGVEDGDVASFRDAIRANLERELKNVLGMRLRSEVADKLAAAHPDLDVPKVMIESEVANLLDGRIPEGQQPSEKALETARPMARKRVVAGLLMGEVARKQELKLDVERVQEVILSIASTYEQPDQVVKMYTSDQRLMSGLQNRVMEEQVANWVADNAKTTDKKLSFDELMRPEQA